MGLLRVTNKGFGCFISLYRFCVNCKVKLSCLSTLFGHYLLSGLISNCSYLLAAPLDFSLSNSLSYSDFSLLDFLPKNPFRPVLIFRSSLQTPLTFCHFYSFVPLSSWSISTKTFHYYEVIDNCLTFYQISSFPRLLPSLPIFCGLL